MQEMILILDFGSQYTQLIARRVRELNVYCEIHPYNDFPEINDAVKGVILSGSPFSVRDENHPSPALGKIKGKMPLLGVCYGAQYLAMTNGGNVEASTKREYGRANLNFVDQSDLLMKGVAEDSQVWMSHADTIQKRPDNSTIICSTGDVENAGYRIDNEDTYAIQFHPEVYHTTDGKTVLANFVNGICGCEHSWTPESYVDSTVASLKKQIGDDKVVLGLSGGVDSSVAAMLLHRAIGENLYCIFVDNGLLRKNEFESVLHQYKDLGLNVKGVDSAQRFYDDLKGESDPETKRKIIGRVFIEVFDDEAQQLEGVKWLGQGTIYPDIIESKSVKGPSATIKSHHNVGGLPDFMKLQVVEPLSSLFKDEVREVGTTLGLSQNILGRHPFPGPGLGIRILGDITEEKVKILQDVDYIYTESLKEEGLYDQIWQAGSILLPVQSVGVMGDERTYENAVALRAVTSTDGMTADWFHFPHEFLAKVSNRIINEVRGVNRVVYDISSKPPATIEWE
ncbi:MAG: glutamine-hydrolyzing GMP synthase [Flavobacteriales bacterium]|jgi:GMP synthase (glutamine-hydrolysing)|nr:glutamine-hydrolyzing GMP synthase [Flavobacteriales bacterium]MBT3964871.1 glutamine-hydrolyzing GMP synthase [Flavobacteriales bacterium]MBT4704069.1 glutamine-hydrolyzing GMP synthase [Flavobacteriales bacterium]MBT4930716.1 glutamine-hydrolyzing GMP synthase [Flavobacteriales bacterium]MBT5132049.1 glutamine-hydrolyzing GMP synthase [Flavobacteriales bacterium]